MKRIEAIVKPSKLDGMEDVLKTAGVEGMTVTEVRGLVPQGTVEMYRGAQYLIDYAPKLRIEVVSDAQLPTVLTVLEGAARTRHLGEGTITVSSVEDVIRIRTGERGLDALGTVAIRSSRAA